MNLVQSGVYRISFGKHFYIGSTLDFDMRKRTHENACKAQKHANWKFQQLYNKHQRFAFVIVRRCNPDIMKDVEQELIDYYTSNKYFINISDSAFHPKPKRIQATWDEVEYESITAFERATGICRASYHKYKNLGIHSTVEMQTASNKSNMYYTVLPNGKKLAFENAKHCLLCYGLKGDDVDVHRINRTRFCKVYKVKQYKLFEWISDNLMEFAPKRKLLDLQMLLPKGQPILVTSPNGENLLFRNQRHCGDYFGLSRGESSAKRLVTHVEAKTRRAQKRMPTGYRVEFIDVRRFEELSKQESIQLL